MPVSVGDIYRFLDSIAPFDTAMKFDNCGLLVGNIDQIVEKVVLSLDISNDVITEAVKLGAKLIISHHPVIFDPIKNLTANSIPYIMASNGISAICAHTNLDIAEKYGVNYCLANSLFLTNIKPLSIYKKNFFNKIVVYAPIGYEEIIIHAMCNNGAGKIGDYSNCSFLSYGKGSFIPFGNANPFIGEKGTGNQVNEAKIEVICPQDKTEKVILEMLKVHPYEQPAFDIFEDKSMFKNTNCGLVGELSESMESSEFALFAKDMLKCNGIRYTQRNERIKKVAVCSGAGGEYLDFAIDKKADAFVTGEIKHHLILKAISCGIMIVDAGHFKTEDVVFKPLIKILKNNFPEVKFKKTEVFSDGIKYL